ncbi:MAG TPA: flavin monoamine oxidase family protein [Alphaproteobacteria bacterium]|nr:flavin monoamine oxidase family protein [Alphaproteobacteria bacterium]
MADNAAPGFNRRDLITMIGLAAGSGAAYQAMAGLGVAKASDYKGPIKLEGAPKGASVLILGAGIAGMTAAYELRQAGYKVRILEYNSRPGGRNWTLRGGDVYTEMGGETQTCNFDKGLYLNPGPWRIPHHHHGILDYCRRFNVMLEPYTQVNHNAYLFSPRAFGGQKVRIREFKADFQGHVAELLAKSTAQGKLDAPVGKDDHEMLLEALRSFGGLDKNFAYVAGEASADYRGWHKPRGGGAGAEPVAGDPLPMAELVRSGLWVNFFNFFLYDYQTTLFQPVGGMDMIGKAFAERVGDLIRYNAKVIRIQQDDHGVTATWEDARSGGEARKETADWCVCTIPLPVLSQIPADFGSKMKAAMAVVPYAAAVKTGLQFKRRFWEEDDAIFGGNSYTDLPINTIGYPQYGMNRGGKGVLLGTYIYDGPNAYEFTALSPAERVRRAVSFGSQIHPQYKDEFENGISVAWHRVPFTMGCSSDWTDEGREAHYEDLAAFDGRIVLAGEHVSYLPAWQEGAVLSALNAVERLHRRAVNQ